MTVRTRLTELGCQALLNDRLPEGMESADETAEAYEDAGIVLGAILSDDGRPLLYQLLDETLGYCGPLYPPEMVEYLKERHVLVPMVVHPESFAASIGFENGFSVRLPGGAEEQE